MNWSGATRASMIRTAPNPVLERVVFQRGGTRAAKLDGVLKVYTDRVELFDVMPAGQLLVHCPVDNIPD